MALTRLLPKRICVFVPSNDSKSVLGNLPGVNVLLDGAIAGK